MAAHVRLSRRSPATDVSELHDLTRPEYVNTPVGGLTGALARTLQDRPIVDKTGLPDRYDIRVLWRPDNMDQAALDEVLAKLPPEFRPPDMNMFEAFEKQAGLKLEAIKTGVQIVVVDHIDKPTEN
jgi:uncharacterized protein (TIGR03435 family)